MLLAVVTVAPGIYLAFKLAAEWLRGRKARRRFCSCSPRIPFYNFLGLKFDQNSVLIPLWALAMWAMMRSLDTRASRLGGRSAGLAAAAAMLTKYWSVFLLAALRTHGAVRPARATLFPLRPRRICTVCDARASCSVRMLVAGGRTIFRR